MPIPSRRVALSARTVIGRSHSPVSESTRRALGATVTGRSVCGRSATALMRGESPRGVAVSERGGGGRGVRPRLRRED